MGSNTRGQDFPVSVIRVVDGDTVHVRRAGFLSWLFRGAPIVVRLYAIDAPESDQRHGSASTAALRRYLKVRRLRMRVSDVDRYGRTVGTLYGAAAGLSDSVNRHMVAEGWAFAYTQYGGHELGVREAEDEARDACRGVWKDARVRRGLDRPWEHRRAQRDALRPASRLRGFALRFLVLAGLVALTLFACWLYFAYF